MLRNESSVLLPGVGVVNLAVQLVPLLSIIAGLKKSRFCETSPVLYCMVQESAMLYYLHGSNITDRGAVVGDRDALIENFVIP